jgi:hypothetical protein
MWSIGLVFPIGGGCFLVLGITSRRILVGRFSIYRVDVLRKLRALFSDVYEAYFEGRG